MNYYDFSYVYPIYCIHMQWWAVADCPWWGRRYSCGRARGSLLLKPTSVPAVVLIFFVVRKTRFYLCTQTILFANKSQPIAILILIFKCSSLWLETVLTLRYRVICTYLWLYFQPSVIDTCYLTSISIRLWPTSSHLLCKHPYNSSYISERGVATEKPKSKGF